MRGGTLKNLEDIKREINGRLSISPVLKSFSDRFCDVAAKLHATLSLLDKCCSGEQEQSEWEDLVSQVSDFCYLVDNLKAEIDETDLNEEEKAALNGIAGRIFMSTMME